MMNKNSSCLKWTWSGGPSPGLCHATMTDVAPAGGLGSEEHIHVEAERLDRQSLFGLNDRPAAMGFARPCVGFRRCQPRRSWRQHPDMSDRCRQIIDRSLHLRCKYVSQHWGGATIRYM